MAALPEATAREYRAIFGDLEQVALAMPVVSGQVARQLVARHRKNAKPLQLAM